MFIRLSHCHHYYPPACTCSDGAWVKHGDGFSQTALPAFKSRSSIRSAVELFVRVLDLFGLRREDEWEITDRFLLECEDRAVRFLLLGVLTVLVGRILSWLIALA